MLESMSKMGSVIGAIVGGSLWDYFHGMELGLPSPMDGTIVPFAVSGSLGLITVSMVLLFVKERGRST